MSETHTQFVGSIPQKYDEHLGPLFFQFYGQDLAGRVKVPAGGSVLEIACGTGISTEHLRRALPNTVSILATDLNDAMLDYAQEVRGEMPNVRYEQADALNMAYGDNAFDAVVCQFGVMFFPDKVKGMAEIARVLKPGGHFHLNVWCSPARNSIADLAHETIASFFAKDPPRFLRVPFSYHDPRQINADLAAVGFGDVALEVVPTTVEVPSARHLATGFVEGNPGIHEIKERASAGPEEIAEVLSAAFQKAYGDGPLRTKLEAIVIHARDGE